MEKTGLFLSWTLTHLTHVNQVFMDRLAGKTFINTVGKDWASKSMECLTRSFFKDEKYDSGPFLLSLFFCKAFQGNP